MDIKSLINAASKGNPTDPLAADDLHGYVPPCAVAALRAASTGQTVLVPAKDRFSIGRDPRNEVVFDEGTVSRMHCAVERHPDRLHYFDAGSTRGTFVDGRARASADLFPGTVVTFGALTCLALSEAMARAALDLDRLIGEPAQVHAGLVAARDTRCLIVVAPRGAAHAELVHALYRSHADRGDAKLVGYPTVPRGADLDRALATARGGWLFLDGSTGELRLSEDTFVRIVRPADRITLVVAVTDLEEIPRALYRLHHQTVTVASMPARLRRDRDGAIDAILAWHRLPLRTPDLHRDLVEAIGRHPWPGDYTQFADVVSFVGRRFAGKSYADAMRGTYHPPASVNRWSLELGVHRSLLGMTSRAG